jgi:phospholipid/cholesterol/gamma-HCH transport system permease protein
MHAAFREIFSKCAFSFTQNVELEFLPGQLHFSKAPQLWARIAINNSVVPILNQRLNIFRTWRFRIIARQIYSYFSEMFMNKGIRAVGQYFLLLSRTFKRPENWREYWKALMRDLDLLGLSSVWIVSIISLFVGAIVTIQTALNLDDALIPDYYVAIAARESIILEFSPTMVSLILAGKVGSNIASTLGSMRVSEQIDALEVMGVNPASYLILPKIIATVFFNPILIVISMFLGLGGGFLAAAYLSDIAPADFIQGLQLEFNTFYVWYAIIKTVVFAFIITTISAYYGYYVTGGSIGVGINATKAVVSSSVAIIVANYILTQIMLG